VIRPAQLDVFLAFVEAINALGGEVLPMFVHDDPLTVHVPPDREAEARVLMDKFNRDLDALRLAEYLKQVPCTT
jgi:hypothetical protein